MPGNRFGKYPSAVKTDDDVKQAVRVLSDNASIRDGMPLPERLPVLRGDMTRAQLQTEINKVINVVNQIIERSE